VVTVIPDFPNMPDFRVATPVLYLMQNVAFKVPMLAEQLIAARKAGLKQSADIFALGCKKRTIFRIKISPRLCGDSLQCAIVI
jgi:hypothetical protein